MGWQVNPKLTNDEILALLRRTVYVTREGAHVVNPVAFINAVEGAPTMETLIPQFSDVRGRSAKEGNTLKKGTFRPEDIRTFWFNDRVTFEGAEAIAAAVIEAGKNPGLGIPH